MPSRGRDSLGVLLLVKMTSDPKAQSGGLQSPPQQNQGGVWKRQFQGLRQTRPVRISKSRARDSAFQTRCPSRLLCPLGSVSAGMEERRSCSGDRSCVTAAGGNQDSVTGGTEEAKLPTRPWSTEHRGQRGPQRGHVRARQGTVAHWAEAQWMTGKGTRAEGTACRTAQRPEAPWGGRESGELDQAAWRPATTDRGWAPVSGACSFVGQTNNSRPHPSYEARSRTLGVSGVRTHFSMDGALAVMQRGSGPASYRPWEDRLGEGEESTSCGAGHPGGAQSAWPLPVPFTEGPVWRQECPAMTRLHDDKLRRAAGQSRWPE